MNASRLKLNLAILFMVIFWASAYVGIRMGLKGYTPGSLALFRYLIASFCMIPIYIKWGPFPKQNKSNLFNVIVLGIFGFTIYNVALNYGEITVSAGITGFLISQIPVIITLLAVLLFKERLTLIGWLGTLVSFIGITLIAFGEQHGIQIDWGIFYILIAVASGSCYSLFQKTLLKTLHPVCFTAQAIWAGTFFLLIYFPNLIHEISKAPLSATLAAIYLGIFPAVIAYLLWSYIMSQLPASKASSCLYIIPICSVIMGWAILGEIPSALSAIGGVIALIGAYGVHRGVIKPKDKHLAPKQEGPLELKIPNGTTSRALDETDKDIGLTECKDVDDLFQKIVPAATKEKKKKNSKK